MSLSKPVWGGYFALWLDFRSPWNQKAKRFCSLSFFLRCRDQGTVPLRFLQYYRPNDGDSKHLWNVDLLLRVFKGQCLQVNPIVAMVLYLWPIMWSKMLKYWKQFVFASVYAARIFFQIISKQKWRVLVQNIYSGLCEQKYKIYKVFQYLSRTIQLICVSNFMYFSGFIQSPRWS
jgi:hypothetical protein